MYTALYIQCRFQVITTLLVTDAVLLRCQQTVLIMASVSRRGPDPAALGSCLSQADEKPAEQIINFRKILTANINRDQATRHKY